MSFRAYRVGDPFKSCGAMLSPKVAEILLTKSKDTGEPVSKLIAIAVDNELEAPNPFYFSMDMPKTVYIENAYVEQAKKIYDYLLKFSSGISPNHLLLNRRDIGVDSKIEFMLAYRELKEQGMIEDCPVPGFTKHPYPGSYRFVKCVTSGLKGMTPAQRRKMEKDALTARLKELEGEE